MYLSNPAGTHRFTVNSGPRQRSTTQSARLVSRSGVQTETIPSSIAYVFP